MPEQNSHVRGQERNLKTVTALHCTALHCTALHCTALHCTALHCTALHCTALHCTALHCTALHCTVLHCCTLYTVQHLFTASWPDTATRTSLCAQETLPGSAAPLLGGLFKGLSELLPALNLNLEGPRVFLCVCIVSYTNSGESLS